MKKIQQARQKLAEMLGRAQYDNKQFWNQRYATNPEKGSGPGSRGDSLSFKRDVIVSLLQAYNISSVVDIGCGDIAILESVEILTYTGIDISDVVIQANRAARPGWTFLCEDLTGSFEPPAADLVLCLDVLIHQRKKAGYLAILEKALRSAGKVALVSGYSSRDQDPGWNVFFYEPLLESIRRICPTGQIERLGEYRGTDLIKVQMAG